ncbi:MAG: hypothetical protein M1569_00250 [Candidatus Marsarchaeota archaeon]|nr:hypothetical protein [Candidatus Marsarchaeota archaeon]
MGGTSNQSASGVQEKERTYREELVKAYGARLADSNMDTASAGELGHIVYYKMLLAQNLLALGKEREANVLKKGTMKSLLSRIASVDSEMFSSLTALDEFDKSVEAVQNEVKVLNKEKDSLIIADNEKRAEYVAALESAKNGDPQSVEELKAQFVNETRLRHEKFTEFINNEFNPKNQEYSRLRKEGMQYQGNLETLMMQSLYLKDITISLMVEHGDVQGAFDLALDTLRRYYDKGIFGSAENLLITCLEITGKSPLGRLGKGKVDNMHELRELGIESALEGVQIAENALVSGKVKVNQNLVAQILHFAVTLNKDAAVLSAKDGNVDDIDAILLDKATEYESKGFKRESQGLRVAASDIYRSLAITALENGNDQDANGLVDKSAALRLAIAEDMESQVFRSRQGDAQLQAPEADETQAAMVQTIKEAQSQASQILYATQLRSDVVNMYLNLGRFQDADKLIRASADKYKANGDEDGYFAMLELGANVASKEAEELQSLKRSSEVDYMHTGTYL